MHHEVDKGEELFQLSELVSLLRALIDIEPAFANVFERSLDNLLKSADPSLLTSVEFHCGNARILLLLEFFQAIELLELHIEDMVLFEDGIAFLSDLNHSTDDLILDEERIEAES